MVELRCCLHNENLLHDNILFWWRTISNSEKSLGCETSNEILYKTKSADKVC